MSVLIGGGTGFIGRHLKRTLLEKGYQVTVLSRKPGEGHLLWSEFYKTGIPQSCTAVVNLSGQSILPAPFEYKIWTKALQQEIIDSRVNSTASLSEAIKAASDRKVSPKVFVSMSGVGYYKPDPAKVYTEESPGGNFDFLSKLSTKWERAAVVPADGSVRRVIIRSGVVLGKDGGAVQQLYWPFYLCFGGKIGSGKQWFPWIHIDDIVGIIVHAIENESVNGVLNGVAPSTNTNEEFTKEFARTMWRPSFFTTPAFVFQLFYGETRAKVLIDGQKVVPKRTLESGYEFKYPDLKSACSEIIQGKK